ncbi:MAG: hypothetical protein J6X89_04340 [Bacteroidales bacterium]|nr:hypothetical protein [Bacteroidales bacterium]
MLGSYDPLRAIERKRRIKKLLPLIIASLLIIIAGIILLLTRSSKAEDVEGVFESAAEKEAIKTLGDIVPVEKPFAERIDTVVNGHLMALFIPHNATPRLFVGNPDDKLRQSSILAFQAADIRADNKEILGEFVLNGKQLTRGIAKRGYCAIIDGNITVGVGEKPPLLGEAIDCGGYFFRQYPLVDEGTPVDNKPKGKTIRRALCSRQGQTFVAVSSGNESFHDFAQILAALGIENAIYICGGEEAYGWAVDEEGNLDQFGHDGYVTKYENESYIIWE